MQKRIDGEQIIEAIKVIKKVCEDNVSNDRCKTCPFEIGGICGITDLEPCNWKVLDYKKFQVLG